MWTTGVYYISATALLAAIVKSIQYNFFRNYAVYFRSLVCGRLCLVCSCFRLFSRPLSSLSFFSFFVVAGTLCLFVTLIFLVSRLGLFACGLVVLPLGANFLVFTRLAGIDFGLRLLRFCVLLFLSLVFRIVCSLATWSL